MKLSIIIPVYNEESTIEKVVGDHIVCINQLEKRISDWELVCLDDASSDGTAQVLARLASQHSKLRVVRHPVNMGIHQSFQDLISEAKGDLIYQTAADGQWPAENLVKMLERLQSDRLDYVIGVRQNRSEVYTIWRQMLSWGFNVIPKIFFGVETRDANSVKLGRAELFRIPIKSKSFFGEIERIVEARKKGFRVGSEAIVFVRRGYGKASGAKWANIVETLRDFFEYWVSEQMGKR